MYRNPKAADASRGSSIMQPLRATKDLKDIWLGSRGPGAASPSVNSAAFWNKKIENVAAEDVFFHEYFQQVAREGKPVKKTPAGDGEGEDAQEDEIWKALVSAQPNIDEEGSDMGFDDLDEEDMASDDDDSPALSLEGSDLDDDDMSVDIEGSEDEELGGVELEGVDVSDDEDDSGVKSKESKPKSRRRMLKDLPMFASADDYAEMLANEEDM